MNVSVMEQFYLAPFKFVGGVSGEREGRVGKLMAAHRDNELKPRAVVAVRPDGVVVKPVPSLDEMLERGLSIAEMAAERRSNRETVRSALDARGIEGTPELPVLSTQMRERIMQGPSIAAFSREVGLGQALVAQMVREAGLRQWVGQEQNIKVADLMRSGLSMKEAIAKLGFSVSSSWTRPGAMVKCPKVFGDLKEFPMWVAACG